MKTQSFNSYIKFLSKKSSIWYTIFLCITIVVLCSCLYKRFSGKVREGFIQKEKYIINFLEKYNFYLKKKYQIKSLSILSDLKATDNLFINKESIK